MAALVHFKVVNDFGLYADVNAACGNNFRRAKKLTDDTAEVTCRQCRELCGFDILALEPKEIGDGRFQVAA